MARRRSLTRKPLAMKATVSSSSKAFDGAGYAKYSQSLFAMKRGTVSAPSESRWVKRMSITFCAGGSRLPAPSSTPRLPLAWKLFPAKTVFVPPSKRDETKRPVSSSLTTKPVRARAIWVTSVCV